MITGEDRNKDRLKKQVLRSLKAPVSSPGRNKAHAELRFLYQFVHQSLCFVTREYHPKVLERLHLLQCISVHLQKTILMHSSTDVFICSKSKISRLKNFAQFCQVRCQCIQNEDAMLKFFVFTSRSKTTHMASFSSSNSCFTAVQQPKSHS